MQRLLTSLPICVSNSDQDKIIIGRRNNWKVEAIFQTPDGPFLSGLVFYNHVDLIPFPGWLDIRGRLRVLVQSQSA